MIDRKTLLLLFVAPISLLAGSEIGLQAMRLAFVWAARLAFEAPVAFAAETDFAVAGASYHVDFWCTPALLWLGAALLLFAAKKDWSSYWRALALVLPLAALAMVANVVLSIALHQRGISWPWAHYPGLALIYATVLLACLKRQFPLPVQQPRPG